MEPKMNSLDSTTSTPVRTGCCRLGN